MKAFKRMLDRVVKPREPNEIDYLSGNLNTMDGFTYFIWDSWRFLNALPTIVMNITFLVFFFIIPYLLFETTGIDIRLFEM